MLRNVKYFSPQNPLLLLSIPIFIGFPHPLIRKRITQRHYHKKSEEFYYLLDGEAEMEIDGVTKKMSSGDAVLIPAGAWHQITANEDAPIKLLCCCAPPYSHEDTYFE